MKDLKVWGWSSFRTHDGKRIQTREIVAARSAAEVRRITGMTRAEWENEGAETWNDGEVAVALASPGVVFWQDFYASDGSPFFS